MTWEQEADPDMGRTPRAEPWKGLRVSSLGVGLKVTDEVTGQHCYTSRTPILWLKSYQLDNYRYKTSEASSGFGEQRTPLESPNPRLCDWTVRPAGRWHVHVPPGSPAALCRGQSPPGSHGRPSALLSESPCLLLPPWPGTCCPLCAHMPLVTLPPPSGRGQQGALPTTSASGHRTPLRPAWPDPGVP